MSKAVINEIDNIKDYDGQSICLTKTVSGMTSIYNSIKKLGSYFSDLVCFVERHDSLDTISDYGHCAARDCDQYPSIKKFCYTDDYIEIIFNGGSKFNHHNNHLYSLLLTKNDYSSDFYITIKSNTLGYESTTNLNFLYEFLEKGWSVSYSDAVKL